MKTLKNVPKAVQDCHLLLEWLIPHLDKFPRLRRFTLGERIETGMLEILEKLIEAAYSKNKFESLRVADPRVSMGTYPGSVTADGRQRNRQGMPTPGLVGRPEGPGAFFRFRVIPIRGIPIG